MASIFNVLDYIEGAEKVGIPRQQAEYQARQLSNLVDNELLTKKFFSTEIRCLEQRLIIKLGGIMIAGIGILGFILRH